MKNLFRLLTLITACLMLTSCTSTKYYDDSNIDVVSQSESDSSIHFVKKTESIKAKNSLDGKLLAFYTFGMPFVVAGCTVRETGRVAGYSLLNLVAGCIAYERAKHGEEGMGFILPDVKKASKNYSEFQKAYEESDLAKYEQYRKPVSKLELTKNTVTEEVNWNDETKVIASTTETLKLETKVSDSAERVSKKASLIGCRVGAVTSVVFGIPSYIIGFILGIYSDT